MPMKKILIVDNIAAAVERGKSMLSRSDFAVFTALTGAEALAVHRTHQIDLIVMGLELQDMRGEEFCARIREDEQLRNVSIVVVGQDADTDEALKARFKANAYMAQPLQPAAFLAKVGQLLQIPVRESYRVLFKVSVAGSSSNESFFCNSQNISSSGVLLETRKQLARGDHISCSFFLPGSGQVASEAEVMRAEQREDVFQYGVRFIDLKPAYRIAIEKFIKNRASRS